jgi:hypothetical protein
MTPKMGHALSIVVVTIKIDSLHLLNRTGRAVLLRLSHTTQAHGGVEPRLQALFILWSRVTPREKPFPLHQELGSQACLGVHSFKDLRKLIRLCVNFENNYFFVF